MTKVCESMVFRDGGGHTIIASYTISPIIAKSEKHLTTVNNNSNDAVIDDSLITCD